MKYTLNKRHTMDIREYQEKQSYYDCTLSMFAIVKDIIWVVSCIYLVHKVVVNSVSS